MTDKRPMFCLRELIFRNNEELDVHLNALLAIDSNSEFEKILRLLQIARKEIGKDYIMTPEQLNNIYTYHPPTGHQTQRYEKLRAKAKELAALMDDLAPDSREKSLAMTNLEQSVMWVNAAIARNE